MKALNVLSMFRKKEEGFTLIELLIVIAIIAILAAIAIPQFAAYTQRSVRASMVADARNAATLEEACFADAQAYQAAAGVTQAAPYNFVAPCTSQIRPSTNNTLAVVIPSGTAGVAYDITVANPNAGAGFSPVTFRADGVCSWANGNNC